MARYCCTLRQKRGFPGKLFFDVINPCRIAKNIFGFRKAVYRGLRKKPEPAARALCQRESVYACQGGRLFIPRLGFLRPSGGMEYGKRENHPRICSFISLLSLLLSLYWNPSCFIQCFLKEIPNKPPDEDLCQKFSRPFDFHVSATPAPTHPAAPDGGDTSAAVQQSFLSPQPVPQSPPTT